MYLKYGFLGFQSRGFVETNYYHRYIKLRIYPEDFLKTEYSITVKDVIPDEGKPFSKIFDETFYR